MDTIPFGTAEIIALIILLILGLWWFVAFLPGKAAITASALLASLSVTPEQPPVPSPKPAVERVQAPLA